MSHTHATADHLAHARVLADSLLANRRDAIALLGDSYGVHMRALSASIKAYAAARSISTMLAMQELLDTVEGRSRLALMVAWVELVAPGGDRDQLVQTLADERSTRVTSAQPAKGGAA